MSLDNQEIYLKDAPEHASLLLQRYIKEKIGAEMSIDTIHVFFGDETHTWAYFSNYSFSDDKSAIIDSADIETINEWLWTRIYGEEMPNNVSVTDVRALAAKLMEPDVTGQLHLVADVRARTMAQMKSKNH